MRREGTICGDEVKFQRKHYGIGTGTNSAITIVPVARRGLSPGGRLPGPPSYTTSEGKIVEIGGFKCSSYGEYEYLKKMQSTRTSDQPDQATTIDLRWVDRSSFF